ncbi:unnamed protein product [Nezara viridula]|uniref:PDEase domain-containing protein n=1 Tax=Nezara viridula TaxID=85310 RepID=A0A9P0HJC4_NEZVI|nr:unnamed protein product [Nezara viridula]
MILTGSRHEIKTVASETRRQNKMLNLGKEELFMNYNLDIYNPVVVTSSLAATSQGYAAYRGVAEMINKQDNVKFCAEDEEIFKNILLHADYVLSCHKLSEEIRKLEACLKTRNETLELLFEPCRHDKINYKNIQVEKDPELYSVNYAPGTVCYLTLCKIIDLMFEDILHRWKLIEPEDRARFLLMVQKVSTDSEPLDFLKIFCSVHCVATIIKRCPNVFTDVEKELLLYSALCHQINVSGTDQELSEDLDIFPDKVGHEYSSSFFYTKLIFKNCQIFSDEEESTQMLDKMSKLMEACYYEMVEGKLEKILVLLANKKFNLEKPRHKHLVRICVMVVAGFAVHFKPFSVSVEYQIKKTLGSSNCFKENQCDPSKKFESFDRVELALTQTRFLDTIVLPWAIILRTILPPTTPMIFRLVEERENWNEITKSDICRDFWIPLKIEPVQGRNNDIISFLESNAKRCQGPDDSSEHVIDYERALEGSQDKNETLEDASLYSGSFNGWYKFKKT